MSWWVAAMAAWVVGSMPLGMTVGRMISTGQTGDLGGLTGPDLAQWLGDPANPPGGAITRPRGAVSGIRVGLNSCGLSLHRLGTDGYAVGTGGAGTSWARAVGRPSRGSDG
jgi:hypothetical protein